VDSNFLGIPEVSSSSWYGEFSEGLFRAIAFGLYGIRQGVNCGDGFCRRSIGVNGLVMELAMRESWGDGEELHIHTGELTVEGRCLQKERLSMLQTTLLWLILLRKFLLSLVGSFRKMVMPSMEKYSGVSGVMTSSVTMRMHFFNSDIPGEIS
jgi:hypothetical protein